MHGGVSLIRVLQVGVPLQAGRRDRRRLFNALLLDRRLRIEPWSVYLRLSELPTTSVPEF